MLLLLFGKSSRSKKGLFFNWGLVFIAFFTLSSAFIVLVVKENQMSETNPTIGAKQFELYQRYQDGEVLGHSLDIAAKRSAERSAHLLALQGGYVAETLDNSECVPKVSESGTPIWINVDKECLPDYFYGYMTLFDQGLAHYYGSDAFSYDKPRYAHFFGEGVLEGSGDVKIISRAFDHVAIDLADPSNVFLTEGFFDPLEGEAFADSIRELRYEGIPTESYFINVTNPTEKLGESGEWVPPAWAEFTGQCHYCGSNRDLLKQYYEDEYTNSDCSSKGCCLGTCPPGTVAVEIPYYSQCGLGTAHGDKRVCRYGCGPTALTMVLEAALNEQQVFMKLFTRQLFDGLNTAADGGTTMGDIVGYVNANYPDMVGEYVTTMYLQDIGDHIVAGEPIIMLMKMEFNDERNLCEGCTKGLHLFTIVGISDNEIIIHDPFAGPTLYTTDEGAYMVLRQSTLAKLHKFPHSYFAIKPRVDLTPGPAGEPEEDAESEPVEGGGTPE